MPAVTLPPREALRIERQRVVHSTQAVLRDRLERSPEAVHASVVRAEAQQAGRGQRDRTWSSGFGGSYQTVGLRDLSGSYRSGAVSPAIATGIAEIFAGAGIEVGVKWPNDLFEPTARRGENARLEGKVGGILCEHLRGHLLVGVGINVRNEVPAGSARLAHSDPERISDLVLDGVLRGLGEVLSDPRFPDRYARFDLLRGLGVTVRSGDRLEHGIAAGVSREGCLLLADADARERAAGELTRMCGGRIERIDAAP